MFFLLGIETGRSFDYGQNRGQHIQRAKHVSQARAQDLGRTITMYCWFYSYNERKRKRLIFSKLEVNLNKGFRALSTEKFSYKDAFEKKP